MTKWPEDKHLAVIFSLMFEGWEPGVAPGKGPMGNPLLPGYLDTATISWAEYAGNCGLKRLLKIMDEGGIKGNVYCSGIMVEKYPELVKQAADAGHEIVAHSYAQNILPVYLDEEAERRYVKKCKQVIVDVTGKAPLGWASPRATGSLKTPEILAENGFKWYCDYMDRDTPYLKETAKGDIAIVPFTMEINDMPMYVRDGNAPEQYFNCLTRVVENWYEKHPEERAVLNITAHCHVFGRPYGAVEFQKAMQYIKTKPYVWIAKTWEVAATVIDID